MEGKKAKGTTYTTSLSTPLVETIYEKIMLKFIVEKKYREPAYTAQMMADEIGYNVRYISAVVRLRYRGNFSQLINDFRIREAMYMITDKHFASMKMEDIATATGFSNRQGFYTVFSRKCGMTPTDYRQRLSMQDGRADIIDIMK